MAALGAGDTTRAAVVVRDHDARPVNRYRDASPELNALGYRLLRAGRGEDALAVFELNVRVHPSYTNGSAGSASPQDQ